MYLIARVGTAAIQRTIIELGEDFSQSHAHMLSNAGTYLIGFGLLLPKPPRLR
ncbi:hypothetical protein SAMN05421666_2575 [Roseovarius nanhaiticus]|uniref:Uncharacterized protein n=1 Tax=Roseovarius nanhaiticus TaxID=573024 RepID=A0A1N7H682_9RHOB|nr:hypothetical protein SAMN05216208_2744 [Roseovarius nanhaiticus]SIS20377.1 hypothetical protein SAMN05421666_2575 [Roseovarius nanhaiticus]